MTNTLGQIKSFVIRTSRMSPAQQRGWELYRQKYVVEFTGGLVTPRQFFPERDESRPLIMDIGFGMGRELALLADARRDCDFIGVEVHTPGVGRLLLDLHERGLTNVQVVRYDAVEVCRTMIAPAVLDGVHLFFPDPWPKARHHKRRLVREGFPELVAPLIKPSGYLYMVTDWQEYAEQMLTIMQRSPLFRNRFPQGDGFAEPQQWRPQTAFERKGLAKGHRIYELLFDRFSQGESY